MQENYAIGIDIGGTNTKFGILDHDGNIIAQQSISTNDDNNNVDDFVEKVYNSIMSLLSANDINLKDIKGIGIGAPNGNLYTGTIEYAPNLKWKGVIPMASLFSKKFGLPCNLTNDANAAAIGEMKFGAAKNKKHFIVITLGTGVGSGIVIDGKIVVGHDGFAGELGHTIIRHNGRVHKGTGLKGTLESYASSGGVVDTAIELLNENQETESVLRRYDSKILNSKLIYDAAITGDEIALKVFEITGQILGESFANFVHFSSPEAIILFGGLSNAGDLLIKPIKHHMEMNLLPIFKNKVTVECSKLHEADAAILGAGSLVWDLQC